MTQIILVISIYCKSGKPFARGDPLPPTHELLAMVQIYAITFARSIPCSYWLAAISQ